jgi:hypothetical protein
MPQPLKFNKCLINNLMGWILLPWTASAMHLNFPLVGTLARVVPMEQHVFLAFSQVAYYDVYVEKIITFTMQITFAFENMYTFPHW